MDHQNQEPSITSVETNDSVMENDRKRYVRKGYGLIFAIFITIFSFTVVPQAIYQEFKALQGYSSFFITNAVLIPTHYLAYILGNLIMIPIYMSKHPFFEKYRIRTNPWPWDADPAAWQIKRKQVFKNWLINSMIGSAMCFIDCHLSELHRTDLESFPTIFEIIWQITLSMICEDTMFYFTHRTLHHPKLYPWIHKKHHEFYTTVSIAAEYAHPIEYAFGNVIPVFVFSKLIGSGMHLATLQFWLAMRVFETVDGHSGYEFSWSPYRLLPFSTSSEYHNYHHSHNVGNYESFFSIWDTLLGTNKSFMKHLKEIEKEDKLEKLRDQYAKQKQH